MAPFNWPYLSCGSSSPVLYLNASVTDPDAVTGGNAGPITAGIDVEVVPVVEHVGDGYGDSQRRRDRS